MILVAAFTPNDILLSICFGVVSALVARWKNKNPYLGFFFGLLFGILGLIATYFLLPVQKLEDDLEEVQSKEKPVATAKEDLMPKQETLWYFLDSEKKQQGPYPESYLKTLLAGGKITPMTYVWKSGLPEWKRIKTQVALCDREELTK
jgi:hypothetical protein